MTETASTTAHRRFLVGWSVTVALGLLSLAAFNTAADPYGKYRQVGAYSAPPSLSLQTPANPARSIKTAPPLEAEFSWTRIGRAELLKRYAGSTVILGSSRARIGIDPQSREFPEGPACNLGLDGTDFDELADVGEHALTKPGLRRILLLLDLHLFAERTPRHPEFEKSLFDTRRNSWDYACDLLFNEQTVQRSTKEWKRWWRQQPTSHDAFGFPRDEMLSCARHPVGYRSRKILESLLTNGGVLDDFRLSEAKLDRLRMFLRDCRTRSVRVDVVVNPQHASLLEAMAAKDGLWPQFEAWLKAVTSIVHAELPANAGLWDFTSIDRYTTEDLLGPDAETRETTEWFWEPSHFRAIVGDVMLARIDGRSDDAFGRCLTPAIVSDHCRVLGSARQAWSAASPEQVAVVSKILGKTESHPASPTSPLITAEAPQATSPR